MNYITKYYALSFQEGIELLTKTGWKQMDNERYLKRNLAEEACFNYITKIWTVIEATKNYKGGLV